MSEVLIRHPESDANRDPVQYRKKKDCNIPVTPLGVKQVLYLANHFNTFLPEYNTENKPVVIYSSIYDRAAIAAQIFKKNTPAIQSSEIIYDECLIERNLGKFAGYTKEEAKIIFKSDNDQYEMDKATIGYYYAAGPEAESPYDVVCRLEDFANNLNPDCVNILFSHGMTLRCLAKILLKASVDEFNTMANPENTSARLLEFKDNKRIDKGYIYTPDLQIKSPRIITHPSGMYQPSKLQA